MQYCSQRMPRRSGLPSISIQISDSRLVCIISDLSCALSVFLASPSSACWPPSSSDVGLGRYLGMLFLCSKDVLLEEFPLLKSLPLRGPGHQELSALFGQPLDRGSGDRVIP